jgi:hypothetical protein
MFRVVIWLMLSYHKTGNTGSISDPTNIAKKGKQSCQQISNGMLMEIKSPSKCEYRIHPSKPSWLHDSHTYRECRRREA